jgi:hypothetical protein
MKYLSNQPFSSKASTNSYRDHFEETFGGKCVKCCKRTHNHVGYYICEGCDATPEEKQATFEATIAMIELDRD